MAWNSFFPFNFTKTLRSQINASLNPGSNYMRSGLINVHNCDFYPSEGYQIIDAPRTLEANTRITTLDEKIDDVFSAAEIAKASYRMRKFQIGGNTDNASAQSYVVKEEYRYGNAPLNTTNSDQWMLSEPYQAVHQTLVSKGLGNIDEAWTDILFDANFVKAPGGSGTNEIGTETSFTTDVTNSYSWTFDLSTAPTNMAQAKYLISQQFNNISILAKVGSTSNINNVVYHIVPVDIYFALADIISSELTNRYRNDTMSSMRDGLGDGYFPIGNNMIINGGGFLPRNVADDGTLGISLLPAAVKFGLVNRPLDQNMPSMFKPYASQIYDIMDYMYDDYGLPRPGSTEYMKMMSPDGVTYEETFMNAFMANMLQSQKIVPAESDMFRFMKNVMTIRATELPPRADEFSQGIAFNAYLFLGAVRAMPELIVRTVFPDIIAPPFLDIQNQMPNNSKGNKLFGRSIKQKKIYKSDEKPGSGMNK